MSEDTDETTPDNADVIDGITSDTPDEIRNFVVANDVAAKYTVMLKQKPEGGGKAWTLSCYTNQHPDVNMLGRQWGPGSYEYVFSWKAENAAGKKEQVTKSFFIELPEHAWADVHEEWLEERNAKRRDKKEKGWKEEAAKARIMGQPVAAAPAPDQFETLKKFLGIAKDLGVPIGGQTKPEKEKEKKSFTERLVDMAPAITALGAIVTPVALALINRPKKQEDNSLTQTLLTHVLNKPPQEDQMAKNVIPFVLGTLKQVMDFKESIQPEEPQSLVEKILDKLAPMVPAVLALATQPKAQLDGNPLVKMARADANIKAVQESPEAALLAVQRLDEEYGFQQANAILKVAGIERPAELSENFRNFPSNGYGKDGQPATQSAPAQDTGDDSLAMD